MTVAKDFASKAVVAFVAFAVVFSMFAPSAKAQSAADMQKMINDLLAQIAALQSQVGGGSSAAAGVCPYTWTRDLSVGSTGMDVMKLQQLLNSDPETRVAATGVGSAGMETETFGPATAAAVSKMQMKYRADILAPAGLVNATGFFGAASRAKANALCAAPVTGGGDTDDEGSTDEDEDMSEDEDEDTSLSGEASLKDLTIDSASDDEVEEGAENVEIATLNVEFEDGDASISRLDVSVDDGSADAWDVLETVSLWVDGEMVAEMDASDEDEYLDETDGTLRFSGLDIVAMEDEEVEIVIGATIQSGVDSDDIATAFNVSVDALRYFDASGVATTESSPTLELGDTVAINIDEAGAEDELVVKAASSDPDSTTLKLEDDQKSDWYTVFAFDLDTDDSVNDIELNEVPVTVELSSSTYNAIVDDAELVINGETIDDVTVTGGTSSTTVLTFDVDGDVVIDAGDRVTAELKLRFKSLLVGNEGMTVTGKVTSVNADAIDAEGADDLSDSQTDGAATGDTHTLRTTGVDVSAKSITESVTTGDNAGDDYATFKIVLDVTAFEQDVFVSPNHATSVTVSVQDGAGATVAGTSTVVITSSADIESAVYKINEGETETVTITVTFDAATAGAAARLQLTNLKFGSTASAVGQTWTALPTNDYRTDIVTLVN